MSEEEDNKGSSSGSKAKMFDLETLFNIFVQKLFPFWYATRFAEELQMEELEQINPTSFLSHRWMNLITVCKVMSESIRAHGDKWSSLADLIDQLVRHRKSKRIIPLTQFQAVEFSEVEQPYRNLVEYGYYECKDIPKESAEHFDENLHDWFGNLREWVNMGYREWDGRLFYYNKEEPKVLGALAVQCQAKGRDFNLNAQVEIEYVDKRVLGAIRSKYYILLMKRESAMQLKYLINEAELECILIDFEWRRSDLAFLVFKKNHHKVHTIVRAILDRRVPKKVIEWGRYLAIRDYPLRAGVSSGGDPNAGGPPSGGDGD